MKKLKSQRLLAHFGLITLVCSNFALRAEEQSEAANFAREQEEIALPTFDITKNDTDEEITPASPIVQPGPNIQYFPMPMVEKPKVVHLSVEGKSGLRRTLDSIAKHMKEFVEFQSRGKVSVNTDVISRAEDEFTNQSEWVEVSEPSEELNPSEVHAPGRLRLVLTPGAHSHVPVIGNAISAKHEMGHELGLGHSSTRIWETQTKVGIFSHEVDRFDPMTTLPGAASYNPPHLHFLRWFSDTEEAYAVDKNEYILRTFYQGKKDRDFKSLKVLYYQVPGSTRTFWFSYVQSGSKFPVKGLDGMGIAVHSTSGTSGADSYYEGLIGPYSPTHMRSGLKFHLSDATKDSIRVKIEVDPNWTLEANAN